MHNATVLRTYGWGSFETIVRHVVGGAPKWCITVTVLLSVSIIYGVILSTLSIPIVLIAKARISGSGFWESCERSIIWKYGCFYREPTFTKVLTAKTTSVGLVLAWVER